MPQPFNNAVMTDAGARLLIRSQIGEVRTEFTRIAVGDGIYTDDEKAMHALQKQERLKSERNSYPISGIGIHSEHCVKITAMITNQDPATGDTLVDEGYFINEMGLFAKEQDGDDDTEVLYSIVTVTGENGDFMPPYNGYSPAQIVQDYYVTVSNSAEVKIKAGGAVALLEDLERLAGLRGSEDTYGMVKLWPHYAVFDGGDATGYALSVAEKDAGTEGTLAYMISSQGADIESVAARMGLLELMYTTDISKNPFSVTFGDIAGLAVEGVWNEAQRRVEF